MLGLCRVFTQQPTWQKVLCRRGRREGGDWGGAREEAGGRTEAGGGGIGGRAGGWGR